MASKGTHYSEEQIIRILRSGNRYQRRRDLPEVGVGGTGSTLTGLITRYRSPDLREFALGLLRDLDAVHNAFIYPWGNGPLEGYICRLKLLKRQMHGRAKLDLLRV